MGYSQIVDIPFIEISKLLAMATLQCNICIELQYYVWEYLTQNDYTLKKFKLTFT